LRRLKLVFGTELSAKNKIQAIGSLAVRVLRYSFGIVNWHQEELQKLDQKTRKLLNIHGQHHPKAEVDLLYVSRKQGGRGLMQLETAHAVGITNLVEYVERKEDPLIQVVRTHQHNTDSAMLQTPTVLRYSFGIVNWHQEELQKLDQKTRKLLTIHGQHHPKADVDHLYVSRKQGGRGLK